MSNLERVSLSKTARLETKNTEATIPPNEKENYFLSEKNNVSYSCKNNENFEESYNKVLEEGESFNLGVFFRKSIHEIKSTI